MSEVSKIGKNIAATEDAIFITDKTGLCCNPIIGTLIGKGEMILKVTGVVWGFGGRRKRIELQQLTGNKMIQEVDWKTFIDSINKGDLVWYV